MEGLRSAAHSWQIRDTSRTLPHSDSRPGSTLKAAPFAPNTRLAPTIGDWSSVPAADALVWLRPLGAGSVADSSSAQRLGENANDRQHDGEDECHLRALTNLSREKNGVRHAFRRKAKGGMMELATPRRM